MKDIHSVSQHAVEIQRNLKLWQSKPLLRDVYHEFYKLIAAEINDTEGSKSVEIGSGVGDIQEVIPHCLRTDVLDQPWIDQVENAYKSSFENASIDNLILLDVFHHLRYPITALTEFQRVLKTGGKIILLEPCISIFGKLIYGPIHPEPIAMKEQITWIAPDGWNADDADYYAAQGNATRLFIHGEGKCHMDNFRVVKAKRFSAFSYIASGGYSGPQLYPHKLHGTMKFVDKILDLFPYLFATRLLVVLENL